ncbi:MAG: hypothetical protein J3T61_10675, partial [Candidatus Brocadiales bacterium]|nr:hypothetical protein [Candidatus Bathyanammoxibius sp.]
IEHPLEVVEDATVAFKEPSQVPAIPETSQATASMQLDPNKFYAPKDSRMFHKPSCRLLDKNSVLIDFSSYENAVDSDGTPCEECFIKPGYQGKVSSWKNSNTFHRPGCFVVQGGTNLIEYNSRTELIAAGRVPCSYCNP